MRITAEFISSKIRECVAEYLKDYGHKSVDQLAEEGLCAELATSVWEECGRPTEKVMQWGDCDEPCHTWLIFEGRHYDMLDPDGAPTQADMKEFSRLTVRELRELARNRNLKFPAGAKRVELERLLGWR